LLDHLKYICIGIWRLLLSLLANTFSPPDCFTPSQRASYHSLQITSLPHSRRGRNTQIASKQAKRETPDNHLFPQIAEIKPLPTPSPHSPKHRVPSSHSLHLHMPASHQPPTTSHKSQALTRTNEAAAEPNRRAPRAAAAVANPNPIDTLPHYC
jgi:hypothetical protein